MSNGEISRAYEYEGMPMSWYADSLGEESKVVTTTDDDGIHVVIYEDDAKVLYTDDDIEVYDYEDGTASRHDKDGNCIGYKDSNDNIYELDENGNLVDSNGNPIDEDIAKDIEQHKEIMSKSKKYKDATENLEEKRQDDGESIKNDAKWQELRAKNHR